MNKASVLKLLAPLAFVVAVGVPSFAEASRVCTTAYVPTSGALGSDGYVYAFYTSQPNCGGSWEGAKYYCSSGATSTACAASSNYRYSLQALLALFDAFREASVEGQFVYAGSTSCNGAGSSCGSYVQFDAT